MELWVFQKGKQNDSGAATIPAMPTSRLGAMLSALALIASVTAYISSFFAPPADKLLPWYVLLFAGAFVNTLVIYFIELPYTKWGLLTRKQFYRDMPSWAPRFGIALSVLWAAHWLWMIKDFGAGVPAIIGGEYVLESHGHILRVLTDSEYLSLKYLELRCFAFSFIAFYFISPCTGGSIADMEKLRRTARQTGETFD